MASGHENWESAGYREYRDVLDRIDSIGAGRYSGRAVSRKNPERRRFLGQVSEDMSIDN